MVRLKVSKNWWSSLRTVPFYFYIVISGLVTLFQIVCTRRVRLFVLNQGLRRNKVLTKYDSFHIWSYVLGLQIVWETILSIGYVSPGEIFSSIGISGIKFTELTWINRLQWSRKYELKYQNRLKSSYNEKVEVRDWSVHIIMQFLATSSSRARVVLGKPFFKWLFWT